MTKKRRGAYCVAWTTLKATKPGSTDEDGSVDLSSLAKTFARLHHDYSAARRLAPASLVADYATVVGYIEQSQAAIASGDVDRIKLMVSHLDSLDRFMTAIQTRSKRLCA